MDVIIINQPNWRNRSFYIDASKLKDNGLIIVECTHIDWKGYKSFPDKYSMTKRDARKYPDIKVDENTFKEIPIKKFYLV